MSRQRRIPAGHGTPYAAWALPNVAAAAVVRAESVRGRQRRIPAATAGAAPFAGDGLESELAGSVRAGVFSPGVSARELETIVAAAVEEGRREGFAAGHDDLLWQGLHLRRRRFRSLCRDRGPSPTASASCLLEPAARVSEGRAVRARCAAAAQSSAPPVQRRIGPVERLRVASRGRRGRGGCRVRPET